MNPAAAISERNTRKTANANATTSSSPTSPRGNIKASAKRPSCTKKLSSTRKCISRHGVTSDSDLPNHPRCHPELVAGPFESEPPPMNVKLKVWRQAGPDAPGQFVKYDAQGVSPNMSFLEMLDSVNETITKTGAEPIAFDHDCREGICGMCSCVINGEPHGPEKKVATCQTYMRSFQDGETITIEPFRAKAFNERTIP